MTASETKSILADFICTDCRFGSINEGECISHDCYELKKTVINALDLLEKAEQKRIIELPVPIGSIVYGINTDDSQVLRMLFRSSQIDAVLKWWGITVFATREEAEARLEELRNG